MSRQEIKQNTLPYFTDTRQYYVVGTIDNLNQYDQLELYLKTNDANFEIRAIIAGIYFDDLDACLEKKLISNDLDELFDGIKKISGKKT